MFVKEYEEKLLPLVQGLESFETLSCTGSKIIHVVSSSSSSSSKKRQEAKEEGKGGSKFQDDNSYM